jgi:diketogulonate reductase-like aldo/keto reductase
MIVTVLQETFKLANGLMMPKIGFGTWQIPDGEATYAAVSFALAHGYRHIDTAHAYGNEASVGRAVRDSGIERSEIFVTSKLPAEVKTHDEALATFDLSMTALGLDHVDLYLIHAPWPWNEMGADYRSENKSVWTAFEQMYATGRTKAIGVSNFNVDDLRSVLDGCAVKPMVDQIKFFIGNMERDIGVR